jgi:hypothetical protein
MEWLAHHVRRNYQQQLIINTLIKVHAQDGFQAGQGAEYRQTSHRLQFLLADESPNH